jgi:diguanylate cyclase (GGDEF)-like protein
MRLLRPPELGLWYAHGSRVKDPFSEITADYLGLEDTARLLRGTPHGQAILLVISGARLGARVVLAEVPVEIGRAPSTALQLDVDSVSRQHLRIEWNGESHVAVDLGSTNGTYVNEQRITRQQLSDGDRVRVGKVLLKYIAGSNVELACHEELQRLMRYDGLTGIANRLQFAETVGQRVDAKDGSGQPLSLILFDLDHFKRVNDDYGHTAGDLVLQQAARAAGTQVTEKELLARIGGEEFGVLCVGSNLGQARALAERLRTAVERAEINFGTRRIPLTVSLGVAERMAEETTESLFKRADTQLYAAKAAGRNCVR